jgi:HEAT repeat protein
MSIQTERDPQRRGAAAAAPVRTEPLTWEEEELAAYEPKRTKAVEEQQRAAAMAALLQRQLPLQWKALREIINIRCESINAKAGRAILRSVDPNPDHMEIRREDDQKIEVLFEPEKKQVTFSGKAFGYNREYELIVQTYDFVDTTVWFSKGTLATEQPDYIAKSMLSVFLRADEVPPAA